MATLEGFLVDAETRSPIRYTPIFVDTRTVASDENGRFKLDLPPGSYTLRVRSPVYEPRTMTVTCPGSYTIQLRRLTL